MDEPTLDINLHKKYFTRCLKSYLPTQYENLDSSRIALAYFILSSLDLLGSGPDTFTSSDRSNIKKWILSCQHPSGGFAGSPNMKFPDCYSSRASSTPWLDGANLNITYFALMSLALVDGLADVKRKQCLEWLRSLQRDDGSFGEVLGVGGRIEGGSDMRYCYCAVAIRWILMKDGEVLEKDIDVEKLVEHLRAGETYDGGISETALHEAHGGYAYCAIAALSLLDRLPSTPGSTEAPQLQKTPGLTNVKITIRWLMERQQNYIAIDEDSGDEESDLELRGRMVGVFNDSKKTTQKPADASELPNLIPLTIDECYYVGQNGRCNKPLDTCYSFWNCGSLDILGQSKLVTREPIRRFLIEQTQHRIGGFGKHAGDPPDIYHSFLGLAALATMRDPSLKELDAALCASVDVKKKIEAFKKATPGLVKQPECRIFDLLEMMMRSKEKDSVEKKERLLEGARRLEVRVAE